MENDRDAAVSSGSGIAQKENCTGSDLFWKYTGCLSKYIHAQMARWSPIDQKVLFITSAGCSKETKDMILEEVQKYKKFDQIYMQEASAAITSNCGAGCFGLIYMLQ